MKIKLRMNHAVKETLYGAEQARWTLKEKCVITATNVIGLAEEVDHM